MFLIFFFNPLGWETELDRKTRPDRKCSNWRQTGRHKLASVGSAWPGILFVYSHINTAYSVTRRTHLAWLWCGTHLDSNHWHILLAFCSTAKNMSELCDAVYVFSSTIRSPVSFHQYFSDISRTVIYQENGCKMSIMCEYINLILYFVRKHAANYRHIFWCKELLEAFAVQFFLQRCYA